MGAFESSTKLDTSKIPVGRSTVTVEVGEYDESSKVYTTSETYTLNVSKALSLTGITVTEDENAVDVDLSKAESSGEIKTTTAVTADEIKLTVTANSAAAKVCLGDSATAFTPGGTVSLDAYETETVDGESYVKIPIKLEIPATNGQEAIAKNYTLWVLIANYPPTISVQPQSVEVECTPTGGAVLRVTAAATGNGTLSYQWYKVSDPEDEKLTGTFATMYMTLVPKDTAGTSQYYCVVTNTVNGKAYSVKTDIATVVVYKSYVAKVNLYKGDEQVLSGQGSWKGNTYDVTVDDLNTYILEVLPKSKDFVDEYSMTVSYNGETGKVGSPPTM